VADLKDLEHESITDMTQDAAIDLLRQIRLSRRIPVKSPKKSTTPKQSRKQKKTPEVTADMAADLLKILGGNK